MLHRTLALTALAAAAGVHPASAQSEADPDASLRLLMVVPGDDIARLEQLGFHAHDHRPRRKGALTLAEVIVPAADLGFLRQAFPTAPLHVLERSRPFAAIAAERRRAQAPGAPPDPAYKTPAEVVAALQAFEQSHPALCKVYDLQSRYGAPTTHEGRQVWVLRVSDHPAVDEDEPNLLVFANNHSRELNSIEVPLFAAEQLLNGYGTDPDLTRLVDDNQVWILANMNPDGLAYVWSNNNLWRKNRRDNGDGTHGVDLNRNYPFMWGICGASTRTGSDTYQGPAAASEPETRMMQMFAAAEGFERMIDFHSYARDIRLPFNPVVIGNVPAAFRSFYDDVHQRTAAAMSYALNTTCCCGTHMEWHNTSRGTMAFLVEMGTAFQPPWPETVAEVARVWPALRGYLLEQTPLRGHVRSLAGGVPLDADVTVAGQAWQANQHVRSAGRFGRYALFIAPGTYDVTFAAAGHDPRTARVTLAANRTVDLDVALTPTRSPTTLAAPATVPVGGSAALQVASPDDAGEPYFVPASLAASPAIRVGERLLPLAAPLLIDLQLGAPSVFVGFLGALDGQGRAAATLRVPSLPTLAGLTFHFAAVTLDPDWPYGIKGISAAAQAVTITP